MRKVILNLAVSLDGFIEGPNGEYDWCFTDQDYGMQAFLERIDAIFYGRKSYDLMRNTEGVNLNMWGDKKNYVFSNSLKEAPENATLINGDIERKVKEIKALNGKDIWLFGGASFTSALVNANLVDEFLMAIHPIILGSGKPLFLDIKKRVNLKLNDSRSYSSGLLVASYSVL